MNIVSWIVFGLIAGAVANWVDPRPANGGVLGAVVLGIVGAIVGGFLSSALFGIDISGFNFTSLLIAVAGSLLVLYIGRLFRGSTV